MVVAGFSLRLIAKVFFSLRNLKVAATCSAPRSQQHKTSFTEYLQQDEPNKERGKCKPGSVAEERLLFSSVAVIYLGLKSP